MQWWYEMNEQKHIVIIKVNIIPADDLAIALLGHQQPWLPLEFGASLLYTNIKWVGFYFETTINIQWENQGIPNYKYTKNKFWRLALNKCVAKSAIQTISKQFNYRVPGRFK